MATNPFYVQPGNDMSQGLSGLGLALQQYGQLNQQRQQEEERRARLQAGTEALQAAINSGDSGEVAKVAAQFPDLSNAAMTLHKFKSEATKQNMVDGMRRILSGEDANTVFEDRVRTVAEAGGDPSHTVREWQRFRENPEASRENIKNWYALYDPKGYEAMFSSQKPDAFTRKLVAAGYEPGTPEFERAARDQLAKSGGVTVQVGPTGQEGGFGADKSKFLEKLAEKQANQWESQTEKADVADQNIADADEMLSLLNSGLETGAFTPLRAGVDKFTKDSLGFSLTGVDPEQAERFQGLSTKLSRQLRQPGEGIMTDADAKAYERVIGGLGTSVEANRRSIEAFKRAQERNKTKAQEMDAWIEKTGTLTGFKEYWNRYMKQNPLFVSGSDKRGDTADGGADVESLLEKYR